MLVASDETNPAEVTLKISPPAKKSLVSEPVSLGLEFSWKGEESKFRFLVPNVPTENLELLDVSQSATTESNGTTTKRFGFNFMPLKNGKAVIRPFPFSYLPKESNTPETMAIAGSEINVIKPPLLSTDIMRHPVFLIASAAAGLIALGLFLSKRKKYSRTPADEAAATPTSMEMRAVEELRCLSEKLETQESLERLLSQSTQIFIAYCHEKFGIASLEDFDRPRMKLDLPDLRQKERLKRLLDMLQSYRFSGQKFERSEVRNIIEDCQTFIAQFEVIEASAP